MNNAAATRKPSKRFTKGQAVTYRCCEKHGMQPATYLFGTVDFHQISLANGQVRNVFKFPGWRTKLQAA